MNSCEKYAWVFCLTSLLAGCATIAKYHQERNKPIPVAKFTRQDACEFVIREDRERLQRVPHAQKAQLPHEQRSKFEDDVNLCVQGKEPYDNHAGVERQLQLFKFIHDTLPDGWFEERRGNSKPPLLRPHVEVTTRNPLVPPEAPANFFTRLSDRGQQAVIQHLWKNDKTDNLKDLLVTLRDAAKEPPATDPFARFRQIPLLVSTSFNSNTPADRLERVYIFIQPSAGASIVDVEKLVLETARSTVPLGKETAVQEVSPTLSIENLLLPADAKAKAAISAKFGRTLEKTLSKQFALRNISLNAARDILFVRQEGQEGIDISGNILSTIALQLPNAPSVVHLFSVEEPKEPEIKPAQPSVKRELQAFQNVGDVNAVVAWVAFARIVVEGGETVSEEDDVVQPQIFSGQFAVNLWRNDTVFYSLVLPHKIDGQCYKVALSYYDEANKEARRIAFKSYVTARKFKEHMTTGATQFREDGELRALVLKSKEGMFRVGFPIGSDGKKNDSNVNMKWIPEDENFKNDLARLYIDVMESSDFPLARKNMFKEEECSALPQR